MREHVNLINFFIIDLFKTWMQPSARCSIMGIWSNLHYLGKYPWLIIAFVYVFTKALKIIIIDSYCTVFKTFTSRYSLRTKRIIYVFKSIHFKTKGILCFGTPCTSVDYLFILSLHIIWYDMIQKTTNAFISTQ